LSSTNKVSIGLRRMVITNVLSFFRLENGPEMAKQVGAAVEVDLAVTNEGLASQSVSIESPQSSTSHFPTAFRLCAGCPVRDWDSSSIGLSMLLETATVLVLGFFFSGFALWRFARSSSSCTSSISLFAPARRRFPDLLVCNRKMNTRGTVDKAEQIKWRDALDVLIGQRGIGRGLRLARECQHQDALWLCSLVPANGTDESEEAARAVRTVMERQGEDPRALFICSRFGIDLLRQAAELGYAPAQAKLSFRVTTTATEKFTWAEKAAAQGDRHGLFCFGYCLWNGLGCKEDRARAIALFKEAAELEDTAGQLWYALGAFAESDWRRYRWLGRAIARGDDGAVFHLQEAATKELELFEEGKGSERVVWEVGAVSKRRMDVANRAMRQCVKLHDEWCKMAKAAIECWIGIGRRLEVAKDIRLVIARLLWGERVEWKLFWPWK
jgi:hypothetical protein